MRYNFFVISFLILSSLEVSAQEFIVARYADRDTHQTIELRHFDSIEMDVYKADRDFHYTTGPKPGESWWQRFKRMLYDKLFRPLFENEGRGTVNVVILLLSIVGVGLMFYFFFKNSKTTSIEKRDLQWGDVFKNPTEIDEDQFNAWIAESEGKGDYNGALKFMYLRFIRQLDRKNLVHYRPEYTNRQVLSKLQDKNIKEVFGEVSRHFEYVWYGHFELSQAEYIRIKSLVQNSTIG